MTGTSWISPSTLSRSVSPAELFSGDELPADRPDWLKLDEWVPEIHDRVKGVWNEAGRPYGEQNGVERRISVAMGKSRPKKAEEEHQRQKELGWDVGNNF